MVKKSKSQRTRSFLWEALILSLVVWFCIRTFFSPVTVVGDSMHPTLKNGEVYTTVASWFDKPEKMDIIHALSSSDGRHVVKRIVASEGDTIEFKEDGLYLNGAIYDKGLGTMETIEEQGSFANENLNHVVTLGEDEYFLLGDNRDNSKDSRYYGVVHKSRIVSVVKLQITKYWNLLHRK